MPPVAESQRIDIRNETLYPLTTLGRYLPITRSKTAVHTWAAEGMKHAHDPSVRVKLETVMYGGIRHSTVEAVYRMLEEANTPLEAQ
jgi:hypothetical protein